VSASTQDCAVSEKIETQGRRLFVGLKGLIDSALKLFWRNSFSHKSLEQNEPLLPRANFGF